VKYTMDLGLPDLLLVGSRYTWCTKQFQGDPIFERLNRAYCNTHWKDKFAESYLLNLPIVCSDHAPILLFVQDQI